MTEQPRGHEALSTLPFLDTALPFPQAIDLLTEKTYQAVTQNVSALIEICQQDIPNCGFDIALLEQLKNDPASMMTNQEGGYSANKGELEYIYQELGRMPFEHVISTFTTEIIPSFFKPKPERNPGCTAMGYYLDLINTIDPKIASFEDGVHTTLTSMRKIDFNPMMLGLIVDDALKLKGTFYHPFEYFIGREDVHKFDESYKQMATPDEVQAYTTGINLTYNQVYWMMTGNTLS